MDYIRKTYRKNPRENVSFISKASFLWTYSILKESFNRVIGVDDLWEPPENDKAEKLSEIIFRAWNEEISKKRNLSDGSLERTHRASLTKVLIRVFGKKYALVMIVHITAEIINLIRPFFVVNILLYFGGSTSVRSVVFNSVCLSLLMILYVFAYRQKVTKSLHLGLKIQTALTSLVYKKCLMLNAVGLRRATPGHIMNITSNDITRFERMTDSTLCLFTSPFIILIVTAIVYNTIGTAAFVGLALLIVLLPLQYKICQLMKDCYSETAKQTDERVKLISEVFHGIQAIKMYTWEEIFFKLIDNIRGKEIKSIKNAFYSRAVFYLLMATSGRIYLYLMLVLYVLLGNYINSNVVFSISLYAYIVTYSGVSQTLRGYVDLGELLTCIKRIQLFLALDEYENNYNINSKDNNDANCSSEFNNEAIVVMNNVTAKWSLESQNPTLDRIKLSVQKGELIGIIGSIGSGKSSIFDVLLREIPVESGSIVSNGDFSYAGQEPWIFPASVRQNIIFGQKFNSSKYSSVIEACSLKYDFDRFAHNDQTLVGERGVTLSGGQKARINLARAVYKEADIYLLDDILSAVDVHIGKQIFRDCVTGYLKNKTRIIITHQLQYVNMMDKIVIMNEGRVEFFGTVEELHGANLDYINLINTHKVENDQTEVEQALNYYNEDGMGTKEIETDDAKRISIHTISSLDVEEECNVQEEIKEDGDFRANKSIVWIYATCGTGILFILSVAAVYLTSQIIATGTEFFLSYWIVIEQIYLDSLQHSNRNNDNNSSSVRFTSELPPPTASSIDFNSVYIIIYTCLIVTLIVVVLVRMPLFSQIATNTSKTIHAQVLHRVLHTPLSFFTDNSSGRMLNRFSNDIGDIDSTFPISIVDYIQVTIEIVGALTLTVIVSRSSIFPVIVLLVSLYILQKYYILAFRNLRRVEALARSPVYSYLNSTLQGLSTVHCTNMSDTLQKEFNSHLDVNTASRYLMIQVSSGFAWTVDLLTTLFFISIVLILLLFENGDDIEAGLIITSLIRIISMVQQSLKFFNDLTQRITSFERLLIYRNLPLEKQPSDLLDDTFKTATDNWPSEGQIEFHNVSLRYRESDANVLKNATIIILPKEKVGIVGRTGAGKSSLINALFRLAHVDGSIKIDGIDTGCVPLGILRSKISIIPQNPTLFSGTVRQNLDPTAEYADYVLIEALSDVGIYSKLLRDKGLYTLIHGEGNNFSLGEKQLICLARAIIRRNCILVMDEATANIDNKTDQQIQKIVRQKFNHCTLLTIAHRLHTIMDSDKILIMDSGTAIEYGSPYKLLTNERSELRKLVDQTGYSTSQYLLKIAKQARDRTVLNCQ